MDAYENVLEQLYVSKPLSADLCTEFLVRRRIEVKKLYWQKP
jgi:vacuolar-type H+-ATPase subunit C/Vma6